MRAIVPFQVPAVTSAALARLNDALTVLPDRSVSAAPDGVATTPAYAIDQERASR
jgi:hypothetical protein